MERWKEQLEKEGYPVFIRQSVEGKWVLTMLFPNCFPALPVCIFPRGELTINVAIVYAVPAWKRKAMLKLCSDLNAEMGAAKFILDDSGTLLLEYSGTHDMIDNAVPEIVERFCDILEQALPRIFRTLYGGLRRAA